MQKTYFISNWKANKTQKQALQWVQAVKKKLPSLSPKVETIVCPSHIHFHLFKSHLSQITLGSQDLSPFSDGAYTGATSARMLSGLIKYVILGHSERRQHFQETDSRVAQKVTQALEYKITPILALSKIGWRKQLNYFNSSQLKKMIIMYEPPEAISQQVGPIGKGQAAPIEEVVSMISQMKKSAPNSPIIYGGSIKSNNITEFMQAKVIDGVLPGSASLDASEWLKMLNNLLKTRG